MEVEEPGVRKPKDRKSRSNSNATKDIKSEKSSSRETNGDTGHKMQFSNSSDLPNGDEPAARVKGNSDKLNDNGAHLDTQNSAVECNRRPHSKKEVNANMCNSSPEHATDDQRAESNYSQNMDADSPLSDDDGDCKGWSDSEDHSKNESSVIAKIIEKYEAEEPLSDDEPSDDDPDEGASSGKQEGVSLSEAYADDACSSGTSSPSLYLSEGKLRPGPGKRLNIDLSSPLYRKPLDMGWKRELVYRNTADTALKRMADIYYYTPGGKKVRSAREVAEHLCGDELTDENFTFFKRPLGINDPTKEIIRDAKRGAIRESSGTPPHKVPKLLKTPKPEGSQKSGSDKEDSGGKTQKNFSRGLFPRIRMNRGSPNAGGSPKPLGRPRKETSILGPAPADGELEMGLLPPSWKEPTAVSPGPAASAAATAGTWTSPGSAKEAEAETEAEADAEESQLGTARIVLERCDELQAGERANGAPAPASKRRPRRKSPAASGVAPPLALPCSIRCRRMLGVVPSLQCRLCLCLYHPECVGLGPLTDTIHSYVCKKCQREIREGKSSVLLSTSKLLDISRSGGPKLAATAAPPPLTPISAMTAADPGSGSSVPGTGTSPPKLQRLPRPGDAPPATGKIYTVPRYVKVARSRDIISSPPASKATNIVGAVTTWLPPSSTIQLSTATTAVAVVAGSGSGSGTTNSISADNSLVTGSPLASGSASPTATEAGPASPPPANVQSLAHVAGKRYIVVPKHNILSVSSAAVAPAAKVADPAPASTAAAAGLVLAAGSPTHGAVQPVQLLSASEAGKVGAGLVLAPGASGAHSGLLLVPVQSPAAASAEPVSASQYVLVNAHTGGIMLGGLARARDESGALLGLARSVPGASAAPPSGLFLQNFMQSLSEGYWALHHVFQYLKVHELLRASRVCRMWRDLAGHPTLWRTVRMKNSQVLDWAGCMEALRRHGTRHLDLRKMLLVDSGRGGGGAAVAASAAEAWEQFCGAVDRVPSLEQLDLCRCPPWVVERVAQRCPQLTHLVATLLQDQPLHLAQLSAMPQLQELRLKGSSRLVLKGQLQALSDLHQLTHLSLTSVKSLGLAAPQLLQSLTQLESLELGECSDLPEEFGMVCLPRLAKLQHLRLEMGQDQCPTFALLEGVSKLPNLKQLELLNFDIKPGFDKALAQCSNVHHLLLIPTYLSQSATTNHMVLGGVLQLAESLRTLVWGITHELLQVTELFIYQCEEQKSGGEGPGSGSMQQMQQPFLPSKKATGGDSIPVLKPVPGRAPSRADEEKGKSHTDPKVDIIPIPHLWKLLSAKLPDTVTRILKIPYSATLRQSLVDHIQRAEGGESGP